MSSPAPGARRAQNVDYDQPGVVRLKRGAVIGLISATAVAAIWAAGATSFIFLRDDLSARLIARQIENQYAYEERIATLKAHVDRLASRQMIDQDSVESRVAELMSRQAQLETRNALVASLAQTVEPNMTQARKTLPDARPAIGAKDGPALPTPVMSFAPASPRPLPVFDEPLRGSTAARPPQDQPRETGEPLKRRVSSLGQSLTAMERQQMATLNAIEAQSRDRASRLRSLMSEVGLDPDRFAQTSDQHGAGVGGPLVPIDETGGDFESALARARSLAQTAQRLTKASKSLPLRHPLGRPADITSSFGVRNDPFTRGYAMHTGVDFRAEHGAPVMATGAGVVVKAEYSGGYGNMVEIEHGNGLVTRFAHMSAILVNEGQRVEPGTVVGRVGSTGRSTGSHLHYETRVSGDATDPTRFMRVGSRHRDLF